MLYNIGRPTVIEFHPSYSEWLLLKQYAKHNTTQAVLVCTVPQR